MKSGSSVNYNEFKVPALFNCGCKCYRGDVTARIDSLMDSCLLESEGDTEDDEETDGTHTHAAISHTFTSSFAASHV